jgi:hypothetical protein
MNIVIHSAFLPDYLPSVFTGGIVKAACGDANITFSFIVFLRKTTCFWYKYE